MPMQTMTLKAHYDGRQIVLDEKFNLPVNAHLIVTVVADAPEQDADSETAWLRAAASSDSLAFLADPAEDIYTPQDGAPFRDEV